MALIVHKVEKAKREPTPEELELKIINLGDEGLKKFISELKECEKGFIKVATRKNMFDIPKKKVVEIYVEQRVCGVNVIRLDEVWFAYSSHESAPEKTEFLCRKPIKDVSIKSNNKTQVLNNSKNCKNYFVSLKLIYQ